MNCTLTVLDTAGIQSYIFNSNELREDIGASHLIYMATTHWVQEVLSQPDVGLTKHNYQVKENEANPYNDQFHLETETANGRTSKLAAKNEKPTRPPATNQSPEGKRMPRPNSTNSPARMSSSSAWFSAVSAIGWPQKTTAVPDGSSARSHSQSTPTVSVPTAAVSCGWRTSSRATSAAMRGVKSSVCKVDMFLEIGELGIGD